MAAHIDVFPTVLDACGVKAPAGLKIDGRSLLPLLGRGDVTWLDRAICIQAHRGDVPHRYHNFALRTKRWKLVHPSGFGRQRFDGEPRLELYDMVADPLEKNDVAASRPGVVAGLRKRYDAWFEDVGSTRPDNYAPPRIVIGTKHETPVVLTRQDWRHVEGRTWGADSIGYWHVSISREGVYDIRVRFRPKSTPGSVRLAVAGVTRVVEIATKATSCSIEGVELKSGETKIEVVLSHAARRRGPWQIDVRRRE